MRIAQVAALLLVLLGPAKLAPAAADGQSLRSCQQTLWGCAPGRSKAVGLPAQRYAELLNLARNLLYSSRFGAAADLDEAVTWLNEATKLWPDVPDAHSLLGQIHQERGHIEAAGPALRRAEELLTGGQSGDIERTDPALALALGLQIALEGDLDAALLRYLRLLPILPKEPRLLYRTADVLMVIGRLEEATLLFGRACTLQQGVSSPSTDIARACTGYLVALDRGERAQAAVVRHRVHALDPNLRVLKYNDFLTPWEREYHTALVFAPASCQRRDALMRFLQGVVGGNKSPAINGVPLSYVRRAEFHLATLAGLVCPRA